LANNPDKAQQRSLKISAAQQNIDASTANINSIQQQKADAQAALTPEQPQPSTPEQVPPQEQVPPEQQQQQAPPPEQVPPEQQQQQASPQEQQPQQQPEPSGPKTAAQQAAELGLTGDDHGRWYDNKGNVAAETEGDILKRTAPLKPKPKNTGTAERMDAAGKKLGLPDS
jgi:hypothetical protein